MEWRNSPPPILKQLGQTTDQWKTLTFHPGAPADHVKTRPGCSGGLGWSTQGRGPHKTAFSPIEMSMASGLSPLLAGLAGLLSAGSPRTETQEQQQPTPGTS